MVEVENFKSFLPQLFLEYSNKILKNGNNIDKMCLAINCIKCNLKQNFASQNWQNRRSFDGKKN